MKPQILSQGLTAFRIGDPAGAWPIFDATGSTLHPGRWNDPAHPVIYAAERFSTALLEKLVAEGLLRREKGEPVAGLLLVAGRA